MQDFTKKGSDILKVKLRRIDLDSLKIKVKQ